MSQNVLQQNFQKQPLVITLIPVNRSPHALQSTPQNDIETTAETIATTPLQRGPQSSPATLDTCFVQPVLLEDFTTATVPHRAPRRYRSSHVTRPNWFLVCGWLGLGIIAIAISIRAWVYVFFPETVVNATATSDNSELVLRILGAMIVNLCSLVFFSVGGGEIGRQLHLAPRRIKQLRQVRRAFYTSTTLGRILQPLSRSSY